MNVRALWASIWVSTTMGVFLLPDSVFAYRPFVSTDAAVADSETAEIELGYFTLAQSHGRTTYGVPGLRLNYGFAHNLEAVGEFGVEEPSDDHAQIVDSAVSLKAVLREGVLQQRDGVSIAVEAGPLLPSTVAGESRLGFQGTAIVSGELLPLTYHLNLGGGVDRARTNPLVAWGVIGELPSTPRSTLRLVGEVNGESVEGRQADNSGLVGCIWQMPASDIFLDVGVRKGFSRAAADWSITAGVSFGFSLHAVAPRTS